jgi:hypothetical protein
MEKVQRKRNLQPCAEDNGIVLSICKRRELLASWGLDKDGLLLKTSAPMRQTLTSAAPSAADSTSLMAKKDGAPWFRSAVL